MGDKGEYLDLFWETAIWSGIHEIKEHDKCSELLWLTHEEVMGKKGRTYHFSHFERDSNLHRLIEFVFNNKRIIDTEYPD